MKLMENLFVLIIVRGNGSNGRNTDASLCSPSSQQMTGVILQSSVAVPVFLLMKTHVSEVIMIIVGGINLVLC